MVDDSSGVGYLFVSRDTNAARPASTIFVRFFSFW